MTLAELAEIEAKAAMTTPGPWSVSAGYEGEDGTDMFAIETDNYYEVAIDVEENNTAFIANARADVPRLVDECKRLRLLMAWYQYASVRPMIGQALGMDRNQCWDAIETMELEGRELAEKDANQ